MNHAEMLPVAHGMILKSQSLKAVAVKGQRFI